LDIIYNCCQLSSHLACEIDTPRTPHHTKNHTATRVQPPPNPPRKPPPRPPPVKAETGWDFRDGGGANYFGITATHPYSPRGSEAPWILLLSLPPGRRIWRKKLTHHPRTRHTTKHTATRVQPPPNPPRKPLPRPPPVQAETGWDFRDGGGAHYFGITAIHTHCTVAPPGPAGLLLLSAYWTSSYCTAYEEAPASCMSIILSAYYSLLHVGVCYYTYIYYKYHTKHTIKITLQESNHSLVSCFDSWSWAEVVIFWEWELNCLARRCQWTALDTLVLSAAGRLLLGYLGASGIALVGR
jgi:hypothetical protein